MMYRLPDPPVYEQTPEYLAYIQKMEAALIQHNIPYKKENNHFYATDDVDLRYMKKLPPLKYLIVEHGFFCQRGSLKSLEGCPEYIRCSFSCRKNKITSLKGGPKYVGHGFDCAENNLTNLTGGPIYVGDSYNCNNNENLTSLKGVAQNEIHQLLCLFCPKLEDLEHAPKYVRYGYFTPLGDFYKWVDVPDHIQLSDRKRDQRLRQAMNKASRSQKKLPLKKAQFKQKPKN